MHILIVYNPRSGRGKAQGLSGVLAASLEHAGHEVRCEPIARGRSDKVLAPVIGDSELVVVCGGDGTVRWAARAICSRDAVLYHAPTGTENLFAREHGMRADAQALLRAVEEWRVQRVDIAECLGRLFLIMCSVGPEAGVIQRLDSMRSGAIRHLSYLKPILHELVRPRTGPESVSVDGREVVCAAHGILVIANSRQYAMRLDPARRAEVSDGQLDVVFLPASGRLELLGWLIRCRLGRHLQRPGVVYARGTSVRVERTPGASPAQIDGELLDVDEGAALEIEIRPAAMRVLACPGNAGPVNE